MTCSRPQRNVHRRGIEPGTPVVVYLSHAAAKTILQYRSSTEVKLNIAIADVGILTQDFCPLPVPIERIDIETEPFSSVCRWNFLSVCNCFSRNVIIIIIMSLVLQVKVSRFAVDLLSSLKTHHCD